MRKNILHLGMAVIACFALFFGTQMMVVAQNASTQGTDFWFSFMNNNSSTPTQTSLILSAERACSVIVQNPNTGWQTSATIPAGGRVDVDIPLAQGYHSSTSDGTVYNLGCHLVASDTISAYSMNYKDASFDGAHLLPTSTLADDYMIETIPPGLNGSTVLLVGTENGTVVNITPSAPTTNGWAANSTQSVTLNAGQVYQFTTTSADGTFSGTRIQTQDCKKIAVFAGGKCAQAPSGCTYCDHIYDPMIPTIYWGNHFVVTTSQSRTKDVVRVTALNAGTTVTKNGAVVANLNAGGTYNFEITSGEGSCYIETSGPSVCYLYVTGQSCGGGSGDPSMVYITPIEQNIKKITFGTYEYAGNTTNHYVNVVTPTVNVASVRLDGANVSGQFSPVNGNPAYSFARISISHATHTLQCDSGLVAHVYGLYNVTSYAYNVGCSAINLTNTMFVNDVNTADIPENQLYCPNRDIDFEVQLNYNYNSIQWDFGDGGSGNTNPCTHQYEESGTYNVLVIIERVGVNNCYGSNFDTLRTIVNIPPPDPIPVYATVCDGGTYDFYGQMLSESGIYYDTIVSGAECDSVMELHLTIVPTDPIPVYNEICPGETFWLLGKSYTQPGVYHDTITTAAGCDSIVELHLSISDVPTVNLGSDKVLCTRDEFPVRLAPSVAHGGTNASYSWSTGQTTPEIEANQPDTYAVTVTNEVGCIGMDEMQIRLQAEMNLEIEQTADFCENGITTLIAHTNAPNIHWNTGESTPEIEAHSYGTYHVRVSDGPCEMSADINIPSCPFYLYFPNCISASFDDGTNDFFFMSDPEAVTEFEIWIYDRWGMLIYHSTDPHFRWNGTVNGKVAANQTFTWRAFGKPKTEDKKYEFHGSLLVL